MVVMEIYKSIISIFILEIMVIFVLNVRYYNFQLFSKQYINDDVDKIRKRFNKYNIIGLFVALFEFLGMLFSDLLFFENYRFESSTLITIVGVTIGITSYIFTFYYKKVNIVPYCKVSSGQSLLPYNDFVGDILDSFFLGAIVSIILHHYRNIFKYSFLYGMMTIIGLMFLLLINIMKIKKHEKVKF